MLQRIARFILVSALMVSIGGQWAVLQTAAWVSMAVSYSMQAGSLSEGLSKTFDGEHPCRLCCLVKKGSESEKKDPKQENTKQKLELFASVADTVIVAPPLVSPFPHAVHDTAVSRMIAPPTPPPRCGIA